MFSQFNNFMNAVESHLVQPQPRRTPQSPSSSRAQEFSPERSDQPPRASSASGSHPLSGSPGTTSHLAESALLNLRKSFVTRAHARPGTPQEHERNERRGSPKPDRELKSFAKTNLEDRLRASFAIGEASPSTTPDVHSHAPSPKPNPTPEPKVENVLSPASTPLPDSPQQTAEENTEPIEHLELPQRVAEVVEVKAAEVSSRTPADETLEDGQGIAEDSNAQTDIAHQEPSTTTTQEETVSQSNEAASGAGDAVQDAVEDGPMEPLDSSDESTVESKLKDAENRISQLQGIVNSANTVLGEYTSVNISNPVGLRVHLQVMRQKCNTLEEEKASLTAKIKSFDERLQELRDTHRLESRSQIELVDSLRQQLDESAAELASAKKQLSQRDSEKQKSEAELVQMKNENQKLKETAKEEEEKRVKAISLLKTVRQKLVKAEKERDDLNKEISSMREGGLAELEKERTERARLENEISNVRAEKEKDIAGLKAHFDREQTLAKERLEREYSARIGQFELEAVAAKASHEKELGILRSQVQALEGSVRSLNREKESLFDQVQLRQAELESSQSHLESLQSTTSELQFQLREAAERISLLEEELSEARQEQESRAYKPFSSAEDEKRIRANVEARYEAKIAELNDRISAIEKERADTEELLARKLQQKVSELETLRRQVDATAHTKEKSDSEVAVLKRENSELQQQISNLSSRLSSLEMYEESFREQEALVQSLRAEVAAQAQTYQLEINSAKEREAQLRAQNKTLRDDLRKVQSSAALLERQRNPGVGYWSNITRQEGGERRQSISSQSDLTTPQSPRSGSPAPSKSEEEVNLEYLRNVILQFLEHKEMRPQLIRVLSIILHFTPQETRRLMAKI